MSCAVRLHGEYFNLRLVGGVGSQSLFSLTVEFDVEHEARVFAAEIAELLNGTITKGIRLAAVIAPHESKTIVEVAYLVKKKDLRAKAIPITLGKKPHLYLMAAYFLSEDAEGEFLTVEASQYGIYLDSDAKELIAHWDYMRQPGNSYPAAHLQVHGDSERFKSLCAKSREDLGLDCPDRELRDAHFPVGGRRFRPSLEDVIEFLIIERFAEPVDNWNEELERSRRVWEERQLQAAVRRNPEVALRQLRLDGRL